MSRSALARRRPDLAGYLSEPRPCAHGFTTGFCHDEADAEARAEFGAIHRHAYAYAAEHHSADEAEAFASFAAAKTAHDLRDAFEAWDLLRREGLA